VGDVHQDVEDRENEEQRAADNRDPADVAADVSVFLGGTGRQWGGRVSDTGCGLRRRTADALA